jgi:positive regulator of sigma E activity
MESRKTEQEIGIVTAIEDGQAWVEIVPQPACETCGAKIFCTPDLTGKRKLKVLNSIEAKVGQQVAIAESSKFLLYLSFLQYGLPLIGFLSGILITSLFSISFTFIPNELFLFSGGLAGLALCAVWGHFQVKKLAETRQVFFSIVEVY